MGLQDKIEKIRQKPEHIRMRYVWFFVAVSMIFVIMLWIFSLQASQEESSCSSAPAENNLFDTEIMSQFGEQKKILEDTQDRFQEALPGSENSQENVSPDNEKPE
jgi:hypothetical protein